jgi:hypothetical protein
MSGHADVDTKPPRLHLHDVRPRSWAIGNASDTARLHASSGYTSPFMMAPPQQHFWYTGPPAYGPGSAHQSSSYVPQTPVMNQSGCTPEYPDIEQWFNSLDSHKERSADGIQFSQYDAMLKEEGFLQLSQLDQEFFNKKELKELLGIGMGTAVLIMQYAQQDIKAIRAGRALIPQM